MEESEKLPLKRVELSLSKFNEVAIPHHLDLLRQHRANIIKYEECGWYGRVRSEQTNARRVTSQLRALLSELSALRGRVRSADLQRFDARTQRSRDLTLQAILHYLETSPISANRLPPPGREGEDSAGEAVVGSAVSSDSVGVLPLPRDAASPAAVDVRPLEPDSDAQPLIHLQINEQELSLQERAEVLAGWSALQAELRALHAVWLHAHAAAAQQRDLVRAVGAHVEHADVDVQAAQAQLSTASRLRGSALSLGAAGVGVGLAAGGPAGALLGLKAGALVALAGAALGYLGASAALSASASASAAAPAPAPRDKSE